MVNTIALAIAVLAVAIPSWGHLILSIKQGRRITRIEYYLGIKGEHSKDGDSENAKRPKHH